MDEFIYLLANPNHIKKKQKIQQNSLENEIFSVLKQKLKQYSVNEMFKKEILLKLETILFEYTIQSTIDDIIEKIEWNSSNKVSDEILSMN
jgi:hypothetical protein